MSTQDKGLVPDYVLVPRASAERYQVLFESAANAGVIAYEWGAETPNGRLHRECGEELKRLLGAAASGWISVEEQLPADDGGKTFYLLAWTEAGQDDYPNSHHGADRPDLVDLANSAFINAQAQRGWFTHWMPLPPPPSIGTPSRSERRPNNPDVVASEQAAREGK